MSYKLVEFEVSDMESFIFEVKGYSSCYLGLIDTPGGFGNPKMYEIAFDDYGLNQIRRGETL